MLVSASLNTGLCPDFIKSHAFRLLKMVLATKPDDLN